MKTLPITLLAMDCIDPMRTIKAMRYSLLDVAFQEVVLVTSRKAFKAEMLNHIGMRGRTEIDVHFVEQSGREDYERAIICTLPEHFQTSHCLFMEWDSGILNPGAWNDEWIRLNYSSDEPFFDYIGAPWPWSFEERGYPKCVYGNAVGNGGFSLRSRRFCQRTAELFDNSPEALRCSDAWICRTLGPTLRAEGFIFASVDTAMQFSVENRIVAGRQVFGFHGKTTIAMNGWKWNFDWLI